MLAMSLRRGPHQGICARQEQCPAKTDRSSRTSREFVALALRTSLRFGVATQTLRRTHSRTSVSRNFRMTYQPTRGKSESRGRELHSKKYGPFYYGEPLYAELINEFRR